MEVIVDTNIYKYCRKGAHVVAKTEFHKDQKAPDHLMSLCKACKKIKNKSYHLRKKEEKQLEAALVKCDAIS